MYSYTEQGYGHQNEDAIASLRHPADSTVLICSLADGQGGRSGGAAASQSAVNACIKTAAGYPPLELADPFIWVSICEAADQHVSAVLDAGYTTLIGLAVIQSFIAGASCGDSAVTLLLGDEFVILTEHQYKNPPVGSGGARLTPFSAHLLEPWKLLVVSDGAWKYVGWDQIENLLRSGVGDRLVPNLRELVLESSGGKLVDDFSAIFIESLREAVHDKQLNPYLCDCSRGRGDAKS